MSELRYCAILSAGRKFKDKRGNIISVPMNGRVPLSLDGPVHLFKNEQIAVSCRTCSMGRANDIARLINEANEWIIYKRNATSIADLHEIMRHFREICDLAFGPGAEIEN